MPTYIIEILDSNGNDCHVDGAQWLDVPFAFAPWWERRAPRGGA